MGDVTRPGRGGVAQRVDGDRPCRPSSSASQQSLPHIARAGLVLRVFWVFVRRFRAAALQA